MTKWLIPALCGLFLGMTLHGAFLTSPQGMQKALGLRRSGGLKAALWGTGMGMALMALLCWLAVMDVDRIEPLRLHAGTLLGGALFGVAASGCGYTPGTALAGLAGRKPLRALCAALGCLVGGMIVPLLPLGEVEKLWQAPAGTLFRMTLDKPYWLNGGFRGQAEVGLVLMALGLVIPAPKAVRQAEPPEPVTELSPLPAENETFVALLPGEEPLVVDTASDGKMQTAEETSEEANHEPTGIFSAEMLPDAENSEIDDELHHLPPEEEVEEIDR